MLNPNGKSRFNINIGKMFRESVLEAFVEVLAANFTEAIDVPLRNIGCVVNRLGQHLSG